MTERDTGLPPDTRTPPGRSLPSPMLSRESIVAEWAATLATTSHVPMSSAEMLRLLDEIAQRVLKITMSDPFCPQDAAAVGVTLVDAHFVDAAALGSSLKAVAAIARSELGVVAPEPGADARGCPAPLPGADLRPDLLERLDAVQEAIATAYIEAMRDRILSEQEAIRRAEITARRRAEEASRASEERFRAVFTEAAIGIALADLDGRIVQGNPAFARMLGYTEAEFCELSVNDFVLPDDIAGMWDSYKAVIRGELQCVRTQRRYLRRDGGVIWSNLTASLIRDARGKPRYTLALLEDISERRLLEERLRHQALHDPLTGLANRTLFFDRLSHSLANPRGRIGICYLDLDGFKLINDTLGHDIGDQLLIAVAARLEGVVGDYTGLAARMGGDEFVVLVEDSKDLAAMTALAGRLLSEIAQPVTAAEHTIHVSASIGVVERPTDGTTATDVVKDADAALYWAKSEGPGEWTVYDPDRKAEDATRLTLTASIRTALERGEFSVFYQPIVDLPGAALQGAEALLRWNHPTLGTLPPDTFIALAEASGVIAALGRWVIEQACRQAWEWHEICPASAPFVSVNLSVRQAAATDLVEDVARILEETKLPAHLLQLELTENALVEAGGRPLDALQKLSGMGVRIAVDDFGTGYSNLAYLRRLPVDTLKLPAPFVREIPVACRAAPDTAEEPIISALVRLAHTLGLTVTAEGVENRDQAAHLSALGCDTAQGWYFARAVLGSDITALLRARPRPALGPFHPFSAFS